MDESADKKLADRYKAVFDNYQDNGAAEGWASLEKKRGKKRPVPYYWLSGAAAVLILAIELGWFLTKPVPKTRKNEITKIDHADKDRSLPAEKSARSRLPDENLAKTPQRPVAAGNGASGEKAGSLQKSAEKFTVRSSTGAELISALKNADLPDAVLTSEPSAENTQALFTIGNVRSDDLLAAGTDELFAKENTPVKKAAYEASPKTDKENAKTRRVLALSIFAGSQVNYGKENTRKNARPTGGVQAELALGRHFSVGLGAGIADYQLAYNDGLPGLPGSNPGAIQNDGASVRTAATGKRSPSFVQNTSVNAPVSSPGNITTSFVSYRFVSASSIELNRVSARFTAIEIPLAFSWKPLTGKTGLSLSAALNSSWMIREAYVADLSIQNFNGTETPVNSQRNEDTFTSFTPFSSVQFSLGVQPGGQKSRLSIEPFARFPLQNQGLEQLRYGAAGVNVRFRLNNAFKDQVMMRIFSGYLAKKLFLYSLLAAALFTLAFFAYQNEQRAIKHLPFTNEMLYQPKPAFAQPLTFT